MLYGLAELAGLIILLAILTGCQSAGGMMKAIANDPANVCVTASTPYGTVAGLRTNTAGTRCNASGGACLCESTGAR